MPTKRRKNKPKPQPTVCGARPWKFGKMTTSSHPFPRALLERGIPITSWADAHGWSRRRVRGWYEEAPNGPRRYIPYTVAKIIEFELQVPATQEVWGNRIRMPDGIEDSQRLPRKGVIPDDVLVSPEDSPRCKCGLSLPCNSCLNIEDLAARPSRGFHVAKETGKMRRK